MSPVCYQNLNKSSMSKDSFNSLDSPEGLNNIKYFFLNSNNPDNFLFSNVLEKPMNNRDSKTLKMNRNDIYENHSCSLVLGPCDYYDEDNKTIEAEKSSQRNMNRKINDVDIDNLASYSSLESPFDLPTIHHNYETPSSISSSYTIRACPEDSQKSNRCISTGNHQSNTLDKNFYANDLIQLTDHIKLSTPWGDPWTSDLTPSLLPPLSKSYSSNQKKSEYTMFPFFLPVYKEKDTLIKDYAESDNHLFHYNTELKSNSVKTPDEIYKVSMETNNNNTYLEEADSLYATDSLSKLFNYSVYLGESVVDDNVSQKKFELNSLKQNFFQSNHNKDNELVLPEKRLSSYSNTLLDLIDPIQSLPSNSSSNKNNENYTLLDSDSHGELHMLSSQKNKTYDLNSNDSTIDCAVSSISGCSNQYGTNFTDKSMLSPIVLAHPEEFKNPSSFLKVYGDPLCQRRSSESNGGLTTSSPTQMILGRNGNWGCDRCGNVNYPRRFRCNKCNEMRDVHGDAIVAEYAAIVYESHLKAYRQSSKIKEDNTANENNQPNRLSISKETNYMLRRSNRPSKQNVDVSGCLPKIDHIKNPTEYFQQKRNETRIIECSKSNEDYEMSNFNINSNTMSTSWDRSKAQILENNSRNIQSGNCSLVNTVGKCSQYGRSVKKRDLGSYKKNKNDQFYANTSFRNFQLSKAFFCNSNCRDEIPQNSNQTSGTHYNSANPDYFYVST